MSIINKLEAKRDEFQDQHDALTYASVPKSILKKKVEILNGLIDAYGNYYNSPRPSLSLSEIQKILDQQYGFEEQKQKILNQLEIALYRRQKNIQTNKVIWCLTGPAGTGKTSLAKVLSQVSNQEFFLCALGGVTDSSLLIGKEDEIGLLTNALVKTESVDALILLDEIDKTPARVQNSLLSILDNTQNANIFNHYLDVGLDFSQVTFVVTANDLKSIPKPLRDRMLVIELPDYTTEQKKKIANKIVQKLFADNVSLDQKNFEISSDALETLINKTNEKGVRQLKMALDEIFDYCLLQWAREVQQGKKESKLVITSGLVKQIIPRNFSDINQDEDQKKSQESHYKEQIKVLQREIEALRKEKKARNKLKETKLNALLILRQIREKFSAEEYHNYEAKINTVSSREEIEVVEKEILMKIKQKPAPPKENRDKIREDKLMKEIKEKNSNLENQLNNLRQLSNSERQKLKKEIENLQKQKKSNWNIKNNIWFIFFIISLVIGGIFSIFRLKKKREKKRSRNSI